MRTGLPGKKKLSDHGIYLQNRETKIFLPRKINYLYENIEIVYLYMTKFTKWI